MTLQFTQKCKQGLTTEITSCIIDTCVRDSAEKTKEITKQMKTVGSLSRHYCIAKQVGMSTSWSAISLFNNDRTPELSLGSAEAMS